MKSYLKAIMHSRSHVLSLLCLSVFGLTPAQAASPDLRQMAVGELATYTFPADYVGDAIVWGADAGDPRLVLVQLPSPAPCTYPAQASQLTMADAQGKVIATRSALISDSFTAFDPSPATGVLSYRHCDRSLHSVTMPDFQPLSVPYLSGRILTLDSPNDTRMTVRNPVLGISRIELTHVRTGAGIGAIEVPNPSRASLMWPSDVSLYRHDGHVKMLATVDQPGDRRFPKAFIHLDMTKGAVLGYRPRYFRCGVAQLGPVWRAGGEARPLAWAAGSCRDDEGTIYWKGGVHVLSDDLETRRLLTVPFIGVPYAWRVVGMIKLKSGPTAVIGGQYDLGQKPMLLNLETGSHEVLPDFWVKETVEVAGRTLIFGHRWNIVGGAIYDGKDFVLYDPELRQFVTDVRGLSVEAAKALGEGRISRLGDRLYLSGVIRRMGKSKDEVVALRLK